MSFSETLSNFFKYVLLFGLLIAAGAGGIYLYNRSKPEPQPAPVVAADPALPSSLNQALQEPPATDKELPSGWLKPVMAANLPVLFKEPDGSPSNLGSDFSALEANVQIQKIRAGKNQPAWNTASALCREIRAIAAERNAATAALLKGPPPPLASSHSKADLDDQVAKQEFFKKAAEQRWLVVVPTHKKKIEVLYRQLLAQEAAAAR